MLDEVFDKMYNFFYILFFHRRIIREWKSNYDEKRKEIYRIEGDICSIFELLDKEGCTMLLYQSETSFANYCKISDRKNNAKFEMLNGDVVPRFRHVKRVIKLLKAHTKKKGGKKIAKTIKTITVSQKDNKKPGKRNKLAK